ncbi:fused DSP-PTPase phosphatase/NAD kinase-like protein [Aliidiomarina indica]|uniref:fused DSP-PTPase phosphatase/NAD kinase-like protein n=1 Tax=Aliidiomarina indica TaxID=2749147 RepID=UPI00188E2980|nr:sulfur transferase domain-containing protein [Aliidiomarina indica]
MNILRFVWAVPLMLAVGVLSACAEARDHHGASAEIPESVADVYNVHRPTDDIFSAGQPTREQLSAFAELGVKNVVNLRPPSETEDFNPAAWATEETMAYFHIPIAGGADLTPHYVGIFHEVMNRIDGESSLLHCGSANRVGAMVALRAIWHQGLELEEAIVLGKAYGLTSLERHVREQAEAHH